MKRYTSLLSLLAVLCLGSAAVAAPAASFNYQGYLAESNSPAGGEYYFQFAVYAAATGGGPTVTVTPPAPLTVVNGYFNTVINHSTVPGLFADGQVKYLEIRVKKAAGDAYTTLTPRQEIHPAPMAQNVDGMLGRNNTFTGNNTFSGTSTFGSSATFNASSIFNANATVLGDLFLNGADSQVKVTTDSSFPFTLDSSSFEGTWLTMRNQRSVLSNNDNPQEWNVIATAINNSEGPRKLLIRDGTAQAVRVALNSQGDVGIGTASPQGKLEVVTGSGRSLRIRDDVVPTIEASGNGSDGLRGYMRMRNVVEIMPRADGSAPGKLDVRNTAGNATITLDGGNGNVSASTISAANMPAIKYAQTSASQRNGSGSFIGSQQNLDIDSIDVTAPAAGFLMVQAMIQTGATGDNSPGETGSYFKLLAGPPGGTLVEQIENGMVGPGGYVIIPINWVIPVTAGQSVRLVTNLYNRSGGSWSYYSHSLHAIFIPNQL